MAEAKPVSTPLGFAIASSLAVLPVLLGIVWLVAVARPADAGSAPAERHADPRRAAAMRTFEAAIVERTDAGPAVGARGVLDGIDACRATWSERHEGGWWRLGTGAAAAPAPAAQAAPPRVAAERIAAQLARFDQTLRRFSARANAAVERPVALDAARWLEAASSGLRSRAFGCDDLAAAVAGAARTTEAELDTWSWRGRTAPRARADWAPTQQTAIALAQSARANPWAGVAGCVVFGAVEPHVLAGPGSLAARACDADARALAVGDPPAPAGAMKPSAVGAPAAPMRPGFATGGGDADASPAERASVVAALGPSPDEPPASERWGVPPSLDAMLSPLDAWRKPIAGRVARLPEGAPVPIGRPVVLTIDPALQALAQKTAACYTGRHDVCRELGLARTSDAGRPPGTGLLEGAMVRMAAVAVVDVASGRIEALAGARTPCARQEVDGPGRDASCDARLPWSVRSRPDALLNPAVFHDAMPASTIKPLLAATFLADGDAGRRLLAAERAGPVRDRVAPPRDAALGDETAPPIATWAAVAAGPSRATLGSAAAAPPRDSLRGELVRSDSARFLDRLFCADRAFAADCVRPWQVAATARAFGWNAGCDAGDGCGRRDLLSGAAADALPAAAPRRTVSFGRLMAEPRGEALRTFVPTRLDPGLVARCAAGADGRRGSDDDWEKCRGGRLVDVVAEGWGQGHARASALGVAGMMAALAAAADGRAAPPPHLVRVGPWAEVGASAAGPSPVPPARSPLSPASSSAAQAPPAPSTAAPSPAAPTLSPVSPAPSPAAPMLPREAAEVVLQALGWTHRSGTARSACAEVFGAARCRTLEGLAGKTGTPSFPGDGLTLDAIAALCRGGAGEVAPARAGTRGTPARDDATTTAERRRRACGPLRPDKWYVAAWRDGGAPDAPWSKAIAVLVERNWSVSTGLVQGAGDHGPNPAAEIALQIAGRRLGWSTAPGPSPARPAVHASAAPVAPAKGTR